LPDPSEIAPTPPRATVREGPDNARGVAWMLVSVVTASAMTVAARELSTEMDSRMVVLLRAALTLVAILPFLPLPALRREMRLTRPRLHLVRGGLIAVSTHLGFFSIASLPLATATVLFFTAPIFATVLAGPINGERVGPRRWAAVLLGFLGALIILRPGLGEFQPATLAALASSLMMALAHALSRGLAEADGPVSAYLSSVVLTLALSLPLAAPVWALPSDGFAWTVVALLVLTSAGRGLGDLQAYRLGEAAVVGVVGYLRLVLIGLAGWWLFAETPDAFTILGGAVIVGSTLYIARRAGAKKPRKPKGNP
jgi:drug/metabolite transporter (DMT)-like permease